MDSVTAVLVTRGDVDMQPVVDSLPGEWEIVIWNNTGVLTRCNPGEKRLEFVVDIPDLKVYGRYAAIEYATGGLIYVQDDDCIVSNPRAIAEAATLENDDWLTCNMPQEFRPHYRDSALVGFGACFGRKLPEELFDRWRLAGGDNWVDSDMFNRCCDVVFTTLCHDDTVRVDVPKEDREMASDQSRMWKQPGHVSERNLVLSVARAIRDPV